MLLRKMRKNARIHSSHFFRFECSRPISTQFESKQKQSTKIWISEPEKAETRPRSTAATTAASAATWPTLPGTQSMRSVFKLKMACICVICLTISHLKPRQDIMVELRTTVTVKCVQGGPSGRRTLFVDIKLKFHPQYELLILNTTFISMSTKGCPRPEGTPCSVTRAK